MTMYMGLILVIFLGLYEVIWRNNKCQKKIIQTVNDQGGKIKSITRATPREEIFSVIYDSNGIEKRSTVKFNFFYKQIWY